ncbi:Ldh family oxidoreductase [Halomonas saccharevitans]|uniref:Malate/lactate/ureidoglycolate dehydrogenase, LDH2 family n=1 Tax=Halomonas saccharevitans TaxID=416872 RepID=A0A1I7CQ83_9GAMM|nr:Ldh family oxidoreductase [Halomonas saccharevitans]SFU01620.1 Malate/lactate/ureidoglycolate dehydrogenase, LDH2 family [Halomonas saccharevitans]
MTTITMTIDELESRVGRIFSNCGVRAETAAAVAGVITAGERDHCKSHGIYRVEGCLRVLKAGKVAPDAIPEMRPGEGPIVRVSAGGGYASPAYEMARPTLIERARRQGFAALVINDCVHFSALWYEVEDLANEGLAALSMCPSHAAMAPSGGRAPLLGTNPFAFGWPRPGKEPYVFDFATTQVARGDIELHEREGKALPEGWAVDPAGQPTTDPSAALSGAMLPFGQHKGSAIATMIELLAGAMLGDFMSQEARDFMDGTRLLPRHGALILAFDPNAFSQGRDRDPLAEGEKLLQGIADQGARLPSQRRYAARRMAQAEGIRLSMEEVALLDRLEAEGLKAVGD